MAVNSILQDCLSHPTDYISKRFRISIILLPSLFTGLLSNQAIAQVSPDTTLNNASTVSFDGSTYAITGGTTNGTNLFHSFDRFSLSAGEAARFDNDTAIANIISRVTGDSISRINGLIEANGNANVFLLNPNGITFGANAELNIGGAFMATTADRFLFENDSEFSATNPDAAPLLAISTPIGIQFGTTPSAIRVNGTGSNLFIDPVFIDVVRSDRPSGLAVADGQTLALVGGDLVFNGGNITAEQGRLELGSVGSNETVLINSSDRVLNLDYTQVDTFEDIRFVNSASADVSGEGGGNAQVYGQTLTLSDGSVILSNTVGADNGGTLNIQLSDSFSADGGSIGDDGFVLIPSGIFAEASIDSTGDAASVSMNAPEITLTDGAQISLGTFSEGNAGTLAVTAQDISLAGISADDFFVSGFLGVADIDATGRGGTINIETKALFLDDEAEIAVTTFGAGDGGNISITANDILLERGADIAASVETVEDFLSTGNGGNIIIETDQLRLRNTGIRITNNEASSASSPSQISALTGSVGNGGSISINADSINMSQGSIIATDVLSTATGDGGPLTIQSNSISATNGAQIVVATAGAGAAGELTIEAQRILLNGADEFASSGLVANAVIGEGKGGDINVTVDILTIEDGANVTVGNFGTLESTQPGSGESGNVSIMANLIRLEDRGIITASSVNGLGNIDIDSEFLLLSNQGNITTNALGEAPGGNIDINTGVLSGIGNSNITANAVNDRGGRITITADNIFGFQVSDLINPAQSATNDITASSRLGSQFSGTVQLNTPDTDSTQLVARLEDEPIDQSNLVGAVCSLDQENNTLVVAGTGGIPTSPAQYVESNSVWSDLRLADTSNSANDPTQEFSIVGEQSYATRTTSPNHLQEITAWRRIQDGSIELVAGKLQQPSRPPTDCSHI